MTDVKQILKNAMAPETLIGKNFGQWEIRRGVILGKEKKEYDRNGFTALCKRVKVEPSINNLHMLDGDGCILDTVMEDSPRELKRHLPIFIHGKGHVLKTGLGLGCVVRGLLKKDDVTKISVIEIDEQIIEVIGEEFQNNPRVNIYHGDALEFDTEILGRIDYAWHDIWVPQNKGLQTLHAQLIGKYKECSKIQGAWAFPREFKRMARSRISFIG